MALQAAELKFSKIFEITDWNIQRNFRFTIESG